MARERDYRPRPGTKALFVDPELGAHVVTVLHQGRRSWGIYTRIEFAEPIRFEGEHWAERVHEVNPGYIHPLPEEVK